MDSSMELANYIDDRLRSYRDSAEYRAALHAEAPGAARTTYGICPTEHRHGETATCYQDHKCKCAGCRGAAQKRNKRARMRRAIASWNTKENAA